MRGRRPLLTLALTLWAGVAAGALDGGTPVELDILALDARARQFAAERVPANINRDDRFRALVDAVFSKGGLDITYGNTATKTAQQTFDSGSGNCLSFTLLFVALAREVGLEAYFHEVSEALSWDRRGDVVVVNMHMYAEVEIDNGTNRVDFLPGQTKHYLATRRIGDQRVLAHYLNNLGVEALAAGDLDGALAHFRDSTTADETLAAAWTNLGVARRRKNDFKAAEESYGRALAIDSSDVTAQWNLASLYLAVGRIDDGERLVAKVEERRQRNPFYQFRQGLMALSERQPKDAVEHLRLAVRLLPEAADFHELLAEAHLEAGHSKRASASLRRALALSDDPAERTRLEARLEDLLTGPEAAKSEI
jgi:Flp pilus assembly protein TadD